MTKLPDFETLLKMNEEDPTSLDKLKKELIEEIIQEAPEHSQKRLRGLQFQIDSEIKISKNPMEALMKISSRMHDSFLQLRDVLNDVSNLRSGSTVKTVSIEKKEAKIMDFKRPE